MRKINPFEGVDLIHLGTVLEKELVLSPDGWMDFSEMKLHGWNESSVDMLAEIYASVWVTFGVVDQFQKAMGIKKSAKDICLELERDDGDDFVGFSYLDDAGILQEFSFSPVSATF